MSEKKFDDIFFSEFKFFADRKEQDDFKFERTLYKAMAFGACLAGHSGKSSFGEFLKKLGLSNEQKITVKQREKIKNKALATGKRVAEMFKK